MAHPESQERLPPGSSGSEAEDLRAFNEDPFLCITKLAEKHGALFSLRLGILGNDPVEGISSNGHWVFLTRPHQLRLMHEADCTHASAALANRLFFGTNEASVSYIDGKDYKRRKGLIRPALNGSGDYTALIESVANQCFSEWPRETPFLLFYELQKLTSKIITEIMCGSMEPGDRETIAALLPKTEDSRAPRHEARQAELSIRAFVYDRLDGYLERALASGRSDVTTALLKLAREGEEQLTREVIRDEVFSLLYTGFSTTSSSLPWALLHILADRDVHGKLMQELRHVIGTGALDRKKLSQLPYLDSTIKETLRLHPVSALNGVRLLLKPMQIDDYLLPAGTILVHCAYLIQRSPESFPNPDEFLPDRFLTQRIDPSAWGPFGGGERICIGRGLALDEMKVLLVKMLLELRMEMLGGMPEARLQGFFMAPMNGAPCILRA